MRRSFVAWNKYPDVVPEETDREYLISGLIENKESYIRISKYYKKGNKVRLLYREDHFPEPKTDEENLLKVLGFFDYREVIVEKDGFYSIETTINGTYEDCCQDLVCESDGDELYWAELPIPPLGYEHPYDVEDRQKAWVENIKKDQEREATEELNECIRNNRYSSLIPKAFPDLQCPETFLGIIVKPDQNALKKAICFCGALTETGLWAHQQFTAATITKAEELFEEDPSVLNGIVDKVIAHVGEQLPDDIEMKSLLSIIAIRYCLQKQDELNYETFFRFAAKSKAFHYFVKRNESILPKNVLTGVLAEILTKGYIRYSRLIRLAELKAPEVIIQNELRILVETLVILFLKIDKPITPELAVELYGTNDAAFGGHYDFGSQYGFTPDGKPCEYDPAVSSGVCGQDENGDAYIPLYGEDEDGNRVRYHARKYLWDGNDDYFYENKWVETEDGEEELVGGKAYKVVETQKV